ncbi:MAG: calcium-binding protein [Candidatus Saccharibacteria bacterium]|nr:calcium-binding protein [Pseudorhodobacter sp.]
MAIFDFAQTPGVRMTGLSFAFLKSLVIDQQTDARIHWAMGSQQLTLIGTDLEATVQNGRLTDMSGGLVTGLFSTFDTPETPFRVAIYDLSVDAATFYGLIVAKDHMGMQALLTAGQDEMHGSDDKDLLAGGAARDMILGMGGSDKILGGSGNDRLDGGTGADTLTGGKGSDQFIFTTAPGKSVDTITDFSAGDDSFVLWRGFFANIGPWGPFGDRFEVGTTATAETTRVIYDAATGDLSYDRDGNGIRAAVVFVHLDAGLDLTAQDFTLTN